jgi:hypothetical protein
MRFLLRVNVRFCTFALRAGLRAGLLAALERTLTLARADFAAREGFLALSRFFSLEVRLALAAITPLFYLRGPCI